MAADKVCWPLVVCLEKYELGHRIPADRFGLKLRIMASVLVVAPRCLLCSTPAVWGYSDKTLSMGDLVTGNVLAELPERVMLFGEITES